MKTCTFLFTAAVLVLSSCAKEIESDDSKGQQLTFTASAAGSETKTVLQEDGVSLWWSPGDQINLFYGSSASSKFTAQNTEAAKLANFTGSINVATGTIEIGHEGKEFWAVYPYSSSRVCDDSSVTISVPANQQPKAGVFPSTQFPSVAKSTSLNLAFYNVCGGLKLSVYNKDVKSITFKATGNQVIAGDVKVGFGENGKPVVSQVVNGVSEITITPSEGQFFQTGKDYYVVMLPSVLSGGFTVTYLRDITVGTYTKTSSIEIKRSNFGVLAQTDKDVIFVPSDEIITFADAVAKQACVAAFDDNNDGEVSYAEAAAATSLEELFYDYTGVQKFIELKYFTGVNNLVKTFKGCASLNEVAIPEHITVISNQAFYGCSSLASISLSEKTTQIGNQAFYNCSGLNAVSIPEKVTTLDDQAFYGASKITSITLPASITTIGSRCFGTTLTSVKMLGTTPATINANSFGATTVIYVPESAEATYKAASGWSSHADYINPKATDLSKYGTANCYIVPAAGTYMFNASVKGNSAESVGTPASAEVLWESFGTDVTPKVGDIIASSSLAGGYVTFSTPETPMNGNAVIAVKDASGTILWSWHIWVCEDWDPVATQQVYYNNAGIAMDRNLGATSAIAGDVHALGLYYQWGRKDPFMGRSSISSNIIAKSTGDWPGAQETTSDIGTIQNTVTNPTLRITASSGKKDWMYDSSSIEYDAPTSIATATPFSIAPTPNVSHDLSDPIE